MSGERPSPLWPEALRKERNLPPVENQQRQTPSTGESSGVPQHGESSQPREQKPIRRGRTTPEGQEVPGTIPSEQGGKQTDQTGEIPRRRQRSEQRREAHPVQPTPAEQPGETGRKAGPEHDPKLRGLASELSGARSDEGVTDFIQRALYFYPDLPPDEALRNYDRFLRGFTFE